jgi:hypothetical protein
MASATKKPRKTAIRPKLGPCGSCSYAFNRTDGCYHRQSSGCSSGCSCPPLICGLGSLLLQRLRPETVLSTVPISFACSSAASVEVWCAEAIHEVIIAMTTLAKAP